MSDWVGSALQQALDKVAANRQLNGYPHLTEAGQWVLSQDGLWTGGFWIGLLWVAYVERCDPVFRQRAEQLLQDFSPRATERQNHDLGMMFCPSAVAGWEITGNASYREVALEAAESLASQFHAQGRFIPGWGFFGGKEWEGAVLVDTLMNVPLLLWAAAETGSERYRKIALAHVDTSLRHHVRPDGSTFHVYRFDPVSGTPQCGDTYQGRSPESCWSRGQAWAITGLATIARQIGEERVLDAAEQLATYYLRHLPGDYVPFWDFAAPAGEPRDSSAAAIAAYGLLRLASLSGSQTYADAARETLHELSARHLAPPEAPSIVLHATADLPHGLGIDESTIYGDYFFVRGLQVLRDSESNRFGCL